MSRYRVMATSSTTDSTGEYCVLDDYDNNITWATSTSTKYQVQQSITVKQKKIIKEEIKIWMDDYLKTF